MPFSSTIFFSICLVLKITCFWLNNYIALTFRKASVKVTRYNDSLVINELFKKIHKSIVSGLNELKISECNYWNRFLTIDVVVCCRPGRKAHQVLRTGRITQGLLPHWDPWQWPVLLSVQPQVHELCQKCSWSAIRLQTWYAALFLLSLSYIYTQEKIIYKYINEKKATIYIRSCRCF
jgi:hypothetical protein